MNIGSSIPNWETHHWNQAFSSVLLSDIEIRLAFGVDEEITELVNELVEFDKTIPHTKDSVVFNPSSDESSSSCSTTSTSEEEDKSNRNRNRKRKRKHQKTMNANNDNNNNNNNIADSSVAIVNNASLDPHRIRLPKILKRDLRKKYPIMFINLMNMGDIDSLSHFFSTFASKDIKIHKRFELPIRTRFEFPSKEVTLSGIPSIVQFYFLLNYLVPDRVFTIENIAVITRSDTMKTEIRVHFNMKATRLYNTNPVEVGSHINALIEDHKIITSLDEMEEINQTPTLNFLATEFQNKYEYLTVPSLLAVKGRLRLIINNHQESLKLDEIFFEAIC